MLAATIQRLESRLEELVATCKKLKVENSILAVERDNLLREREFMREELDRILSRFSSNDEVTP